MRRKILIIRNITLPHRSKVHFTFPASVESIYSLKRSRLTRLKFTPSGDASKKTG